MSNAGSHYRIYLPNGVPVMERIPANRVTPRLLADTGALVAPTKLGAVHKFIAQKERDIEESKRQIEQARALILPHWEGVQEGGDSDE